MPAVITKTKRKDLFQEIFTTLHHWPEREQRVFSLAHYSGQSSDAIARSLQLESREVDTILKQCEHRLLDSLRDLRDSTPEKPSFDPDNAARAAAREQDVKSADTLASKLRNIRRRSRMPAN